MVRAPLTREDLREELDRLRDEIRPRYATKADLSELETPLDQVDDWPYGWLGRCGYLCSCVSTDIHRLDEGPTSFIVAEGQLHSSDEQISGYR